MHCNMSPQKDRLTHAGRVKTAKLAARVEPEALLAVLKNPSYHFKRIGLEAGPLSQWLYSAPNQVLHQPLGGPPIPFLVVARRIPGYSRRGDAKAGHRRDNVLPNPSTYSAKTRAIPSSHSALRRPSRGGWLYVPL